MTIIPPDDGSAGRIADERLATGPPQLAKLHENHCLIGRQPSMTGNVFRLWFEELRRLVPTE